MKRYLGRTADLTLSRLEEIAARLSGDMTSPSDDILSEIFSNEPG